jgi:gas vesicle protein
MDQINMKIGRYIVGLISGLTFGMLFAPKKGEDLRREIMHKGKESHTEGLKALGNAFRGAGEDALKELKGLSEHEQVAAFLELSHDKMKSFLEAAEEKGYDVAAAVQEKFEDLAGMAKCKMEEIKKKAVTVEKEVVGKGVKAKRNTSFKERKASLKKSVKGILKKK